uniref:Uncharacterized protein n=1 Tax=Candidatus Kentrum sp. LPFa TaxID=2126335 RepID=A0A450XUS9_9GAMM|nr:MAG: hypothetical protein BECKLPF1236A_GA0070988_1020311 [Candidatus Kentron sp. LPFa]VFK33029.1 MAG: hypothetical protein BECKLPF1236C_GA0070990_1018911 [Candidatus Kentron sp. LPFa]
MAGIMSEEPEEGENLPSCLLCLKMARMVAGMPATPGTIQRPFAPRQPLVPPAAVPPQKAPAPGYQTVRAPSLFFLAGAQLAEAEVALQVMLDVLGHVGFAFVGICRSTILLFLEEKIPRNDPETDGLFIWP